MGLLRQLAVVLLCAPGVVGWWNTDTLIDRAETTGLGGDGAQNGDSPPSPEGSLDVGMSRRKSITEGMIEQVNSESSESLEQFLMGKRERLLHQPLAAVAERGLPPMPTSVVDMEELPEMQNINLEDQVAHTGVGMMDTQKRPHDIRDPARFVVGGAAEYHQAIVNPTVTSLGARGGHDGAKEAVEEEDAETAATAAGSGGMFPGLQPSARGAFELNGGHRLRAAMRGQSIDTQAPPYPRMSINDMAGRYEGLGGLGDWTASVVGCELLHKSLRRSKASLLSKSAFSANSGKTAFSAYTDPTRVRAMEMACFRFLSTDTQGQTPAACHGAVQKLDACYEQFGTAQGSCSEVKARADAACSAGGMAADDRGLGLTNKQMEENACERSAQLAESCENMDDMMSHAGEGVSGMLNALARCEPLRQKHRESCHIGDGTAENRGAGERQVTELVDANGNKLGMLKEVLEDGTFQENDVV